jgi:hypothetical protein
VDEEATIPVEISTLWKLREVEDAARQLPVEHQSERLRQALTDLAATSPSHQTGQSISD